MRLTVKEQGNIGNDYYSILRDEETGVNYLCMGN